MALILMVLVAAGLMRTAYLVHATARPDFEWSDPDGYTRQARGLRDGEGHWRWTFESVRYEWGGRSWSLPPAYPVFLSLFARNSRKFSPYDAALAQVALGTLLVALVAWLACRLHTLAAGVLAAALWAIWLPNIAAPSIFIQEHLFVPLVVLAFALLLETLVGERSSWWAFAAGVVFGLAALTRAMPLYFMPIAALAVALSGPRRGRGWRRAGAMVAGFLLVSVPYITWLSIHAGELILIDNHGPIILEPAARSDEVPSLADTLSLIARDFADHPVGFLEQKLSLAKAQFSLHGGRWLQVYGGADSASSAAAWKLVAHLAIDLTFILVCLGAPLGVIVARQREHAVVLLLWIIVAMLVTVAAGFGGPRYRAPFEPFLIVLASACYAGHWRPVGRGLLSLGALGAVALALVVLPQVPRSLDARAQYGLLRWSPFSTSREAAATGQAGFNVLSQDGALHFSLSLDETLGPGERAEARAIIGGNEVWRAKFDEARQVEVHLPAARPGLTFVELQVEGRGPGGTRPLRFRVTLFTRD